MKIEETLQFPNASLTKVGPFANTENGVAWGLNVEASMITKEAIELLSCEYLFAANSTSREGFSEVDLVAEIDNVQINLPHPFDEAMPGINLLPEKIDKFAVFKCPGAGVGVKFRVKMNGGQPPHDLMDFLWTYGQKTFLCKLQPLQPPLEGTQPAEGKAKKEEAPDPQMNLIEAPANTETAVVHTPDEWEPDGLYVRDAGDVVAKIRINRGMSKWKYMFRIQDKDAVATTEAVDDREWKTHAEALEMAAMHLSATVMTAFRRNQSKLSKEQREAARLVAKWADDVAKRPQFYIDEQQARIKGHMAEGDDK